MRAAIAGECMGSTYIAAIVYSITGDGKKASFGPKKKQKKEKTVQVSRARSLSIPTRSRVVAQVFGSHARFSILL